MLLLMMERSETLSCAASPRSEEPACRDDWVAAGLAWMNCYPSIALASGRYRSVTAEIYPTERTTPPRSVLECATPADDDAEPSAADAFVSLWSTTSKHLLSPPATSAFLITHPPP